MSRQLYARVFTQILDSSLAEDWQTRHVFEDLLKLADDGVVDMTREAIARRTNIPLDVVNSAITKLESPDPASRDATEEGRRLIRLDAHRDWGWQIVNWSKYESIRSSEDQRERTRARVRRHRERQAQQGETLPPAPPTQNADANADADAPLREGHRPLQGVTPLPVTTGVGTATTADDDTWLKGLAEDADYSNLDVKHEYAKMLNWFRKHHRKPTRNGFIKWLNDCLPSRRKRPLDTPARPPVPSVPKESGPAQFIPR